MADDEIQTPLPESGADTAAVAVATPETDPTPSQVESRAVVANLDDEIADLWAKAEGREPVEPRQQAPERDAPKAAARPAEPVEAETPALDQSEIDRQAEVRARQKIQSEQDDALRSSERIRAEQAYQQRADAYLGNQADYEAVNAALRQVSRTGDYAALDNLDVMLPNGQRVSQVKGGQKGLTQEEAGAILDAWDMARGFQNVVGDAKVQRILSLWDSAVMASLGDPDVDRAAVIKHAEPADQMRTAIETTRASVTKRLNAEHEASDKVKDAEIARLTERVTSLTNERGNLTSQRTAARAATMDRPGQPGNPRQDLPSPEELRAMSADDFFKSNLHDRLLSSIPGGQASRRAG